MGNNKKNIINKLSALILIIALSAGAVPSVVLAAENKSANTAGVVADAIQDIVTAYTEINAEDLSALETLRNDIRELTTAYESLSMEEQMLLSHSMNYIQEIGAEVESMNAAVDSVRQGGSINQEESGTENSWRYLNGEAVSDVFDVIELEVQSVSDQKTDADIPYSIREEESTLDDSIASIQDIDGSDQLVGNGDTYQGIDVSSHQGYIDWQQVKNAGIDFAIIRCGYGGNLSSQDDSRWEYNASSCESLGIPYGVYLYSYAENSSEIDGEVQHTLRLLQGHTPNLPVYIDIEENIQFALGGDVLSSLATRFCSQICNAGYKSGLYTSRSHWNTYFGTFASLPSYYHWVAEYNSSCNYSGRYETWQYTSTGRVNGIAGNVDCNIWYGSFDDIISPHPTVSFTPWSNDNYTYIRETDASIGQEINVSGGTCTSTGMYLYDSNGTYLAQGSNSSYTLARVYFQINAEMGYTLRGGTTYKYKFYAVVNGQTYWSSEYSFTTPPPRGSEMSSGNSRVLPDGDYQIVSAADPSCYLDIAGTAQPAAGGTNVALCGQNSGYLPAYEIWNITYSDGFYTIRQKDTDMCLDVANAETAAGANIQMCQSNGSSAQKWAISWFDTSDGYRVKAKCSGFSLDSCGGISNGANVQQWVQNNSDAQRWLFIPYEPERTIADGRYILVSGLDPGKVLDIAGDTGDIGDGTNVQIWNDGSLSRYNAIDVKYLDHGYYRLTHAASGKSIEVKDSGTANGTNIQVSVTADRNNQKWAITRLGDGYMLTSRNSGLVMDVAGGETADGTNIRQHYYNGSDATKWKFVRAEYTVKYNANGGSNAPASQTKYYRNALTLSSAKPTQSGKIFKGWSTSRTAASAQYSAGGSYTEDSDITLYAVWQDQKKQISDCTVTLSNTSYTYNGSARKPAVTVKDGTATLTSGTDYTAAYADNINAGTATVTITGLGNYTGTVSKSFTINKAAPTLTFASGTVSKTTFDAAFTNTLTKKTDGTVQFKSSNTAVAAVNSTSGKVTIKGIGTATITATAAAGSNYKAGSASYTLTVADGRTNLSDCTVTLSKTSYTYSGSARKPAVTVKYGTTTLTSGTDYTAAYADNINAGTATVTITGQGNYTGIVSKSFTINKAAPTLTFASKTVSKTTFDAAFTNKLTKKTDGTVKFKSSNTAVATVTSTGGKVTIKGIGTATITATAAAGTNYKAGSAAYTLTVIDGRTDISDCTVTLSRTSYTYSGSARKPAVTVKYGATTLTSGTDYTVAYADNINAGTATVTITGQGDYTGTVSRNFTIKKAAPTLTFASGTVSKTAIDAAFTNTLTKKTDGAVKFKSSDTAVAAVNSTSGKVTIKGIGTATITATAASGANYKAGSASYELEVTAASIEKASIAGVSLSYGYSGKAYTPKMTVKVNGVTLVEDQDYTVLIEDNKDPGTATITLTGIGKCIGTRIKQFEIVDCVSAIVSGKTYQLIPKNNSKTAVCAYSGRMVNNTKVYITDRSSSEAMRFKAVKNADGTWKFVNAKCELALAVYHNSSEVGAGTVLYDQTSRAAQNWKLSKKSDNSFAIMNAVSGLSIAMSDASAVKGTTLSMAETASNGLQRFYIAEAAEVDASFDGTYSVRASKDREFALNIASSSESDGANVNLYEYSDTDAKKFKAIYSGAGYYRFVNLNSGMVLSVEGNTKKDGTNVIQSTWKAQSGQRWKITENPNGTVTLKNALGTVLHLNSNKTANGTNVVAKNSATTGAQKWYLE